LLAVKFLQDHQLSSDYLEPLATYILDTQQSLLATPKSNYSPTAASPASTATTAEEIPTRSSSPKDEPAPTAVVPASPLAVQEEEREAESSPFSQLIDDNNDSSLLSSPPPPPPPPLSLLAGDSGSMLDETTSTISFEAAVEAFDRATDLINEGNIQQAAPLYDYVSNRLINKLAYDDKT
jgi:hypothetical protein